MIFCSYEKPVESLVSDSDGDAVLPVWMELRFLSLPQVFEMVVAKADTGIDKSRIALSISDITMFLFIIKRL